MKSKITSNGIIPSVIATVINPIGLIETITIALTLIDNVKIIKIIILNITNNIF
ncbi:MAG: hypothetical protein V6008_02180 [Candidatus Dasytiphilus stammeri]